MEETKAYNIIINNEMFKQEQKFLQHGDSSVFEHSKNVANTCLIIAEKLKINVDKESLIKGALLHDYFLYDWHDKENEHKLHAISHPKVARDNAKKDFGLSKKEENMILSHMFPIGYVLPKYKESVILCIADKYCAICETLSADKVLQSVLCKVKS